MAEIEKGAKIELIPVRAIKPSPVQLVVINPEVERALLEDMRKGVDSIDPIRVRRLTPEEIEECKAKYPHAIYEVIDGHKRLRNAELLHWEQIKAIVMDVSREEAYEIAYRKNRERGLIDPMLEALYFKHLYIDLKLPAYKIAEKFNLSESYVRKVIARVRIEPEAVRKIVRQTIVGKPLKGKHLDAIATAPPEAQPKLAEKVVEEKLSPKEAKIVAQAVTKKPEILALPKPKLIEEAEKIVSPPIEKPPEEIALERFKEVGKHYPTIIVGYVASKYTGKYLEDVLKAIFWLLWQKLDETSRENITAEAIKMAGEKGFEQPIVG